MNIQWVGSPNYTPGRTQAITKIVIHWMAGTLAVTDAVFTNPSSQVSAHYGIENDTIHQYVNDGDTAWHAISANPYSIGIEHSAQPGRDASEATINTSAQLVAQLCSKHNIAINSGNIIPHSQVVATQCPGTIPIDTIIQKAQAITKGEDMPNSGDAVNYIRGLRGDPSYNPSQSEIDQAMKTSYKDWSYILGFPNSGDATNFIKAEKGEEYKPSQSEVNKAMSLSFKGWDYRLAGIAQDSDFTPVNQTVYVKK